MSVTINAKEGDVIRVYFHPSKTVTGTVELITENKIVLRPQALVELHVKEDKTSNSYFMRNVTVDSENCMSISIDLNYIFAYDIPSFNAIINSMTSDLIGHSLIDFDETLLGDFKKELEAWKFFRRVLHYYDKDGFCINI